MIRHPLPDVWPAETAGAPYSDAEQSAAAAPTIARP